MASKKTPTKKRPIKRKKTVNKKRATTRKKNPISQPLYCVLYLSKKGMLAVSNVSRKGVSVATTLEEAKTFKSYSGAQKLRAEVLKKLKHVKPEEMIVHEYRVHYPKL